MAFMAFSVFTCDEIEWKSWEWQWEKSKKAQKGVENLWCLS